MNRRVTALAAQEYEADSQSHDRDRLQRTVTEHYERIWRTLRRLGVPERAVEDAAQQVLIVFSRRLDAVRPGAEGAYLIGVATRVAADVRKKFARAREDLDPDAIAAKLSGAPSVEELIDRDRARRMLDRVLEQMPDELRIVFVLFEFEELTMAVIAETLGLPAGTVASRLRRARQVFEASALRISTARRQP